MKHAQNVINLLSTNFIVKFFSLVLGFGLWSILSETQMYELCYSVPFCFYGNKSNSIDYAKPVEITLRGQKKSFFLFDPKSLALHINTDLLNNEINTIIITEDQLLLPSSLSMVNSNPRIVQVPVTTKENL